ncbi:MAG: protein-disulfide reductase DsbD [Gammaproteobacteria bacterium]|nr:protein-disulfide reductase DsbD [Gammaproteobacteria bacterium]
MMNKIKYTLLIALLWPLVIQAADEFVPPPPAEVFQYEVEAQPGRILIHWSVMPEFYLYKHRFSFTSRTPGINLGKALYPAGEIHEDEFFGRQEIFREKFTVSIPYSGKATGGSFELEMKLQGCADYGFCYVPLTWTATLQLPASPAGGGNKLLALLGNSAGAGAREFLPEEQAFQLETWMEDAYTVVARWLIADGYYLYAEKFTASSDSRLAQPGPLDLPQGVIKTDRNFGEMEIYYEQIEIRIPLSRAGPEAATVSLSLGFQGCAEDAICYPPGTRIVAVDLPETSADAVRPALKKSETDMLSDLVKNSSPLVFVAAFFGFGLLLAFTPCVLPMVPILSGIIASQGENVTTARAFSLSLTYVLGMALTYTIAGAAFASAGQQVQAVFQQPWIIGLFAALFVAMALAMFGFYEIQMPGALQSRASDASGTQKRGTFIGTAIMGALSALIVTACVAPPLVAALTVIGQAGDVFRGGLALFSLSMGMGTPLLLVGASAGKLLPKAGPWMVTVKALFGVMLLGVAVWMVGRIIPGPVTLALWGATALVGAYYLGAPRQITGAGRWRRLRQAAALGALIYGLLAIAGALGGGSNPLRPVESITGSQANHVTFQRIKSVAELDKALAGAAAQHRAALLDFYADWCVSCIEMEEYTFTDPAVQAALGDTLLLQADVTANDQVDQELLQHFGIYGPPTIVFFDHQGRELQGYRVVGFKPAEEFSAHLTEAFGAR